MFTHLFRDKRYLLLLYQTLHPEDTSATEEDLVSITIDNVFVDGQYNDLGFLVGDRLMILAEAQSTWSVNIVIRGLFYLVNSLQEYCRRRNCDLYRSRKIELPKMELYAVYTGDRDDKPEELSLTEDFYDGEKCAVDVTVKMLYGSVVSDGAGTEDILGQYVDFCKVYTEQLRLYGKTKKTITETIRICRESNVLKEYLESREMEVVDMMAFGIDKDFYLQIYWKNRMAEKEEEVTQQVTERVTEQVTEQVTQQVTEQVTQQVTEQVTQQVTERVTQQVTEQVTQQVTEQVTQQVTEQVTQQVTDRTKREAVLKMLREGKLSVDEIAYYQDLPIDRVMRLRDEILLPV